MEKRAASRTTNVRSRPRSRAEVDAVDRAILRVLVDDARTPNSSIAAAVGIAPSTCMLRIRRLQDTGVIRGFRTEIAPEALGRPLQALIFVRLQAHARVNIGDFANRFIDMPGVLNVFFLGGATDFIIHFAATSPDDVRDFVVRNVSASREVSSTETNLVFQHLGGSLLPPSSKSARR